MYFSKISNEEKANIFTHGLGFLLALVGLPALFSNFENNSSNYRIALIVFAISMLFVYASSTIYHLMISEKKKFLWKKIDHIAIYFLIAGTNTPLKYQYFSLIYYIILGGLGIGVIVPMLEKMPIKSLYWLISGGLFYLVGTVFYMWKKLRYNHAIWHIFVIAGTFCHYIAVLNSIYF